MEHAGHAQQQLPGSSVEVRITCGSCSRTWRIKKGAEQADRGQHRNIYTVQVKLSQGPAGHSDLTPRKESSATRLSWASEPNFSAAPPRELMSASSEMPPSTDGLDLSPPLNEGVVERVVREKNPHATRFTLMLS